LARRGKQMLSQSTNPAPATHFTKIIAIELHI